MCEVLHINQVMHMKRKRKMIRNLKEKLIGDRAFYMGVLAIAVPIMIQNGITNFVSLLDNIMVGKVGTEQMSGVAIVNQLLFVYNLCIFGGTSGAGIFTAQFYGKGDHEGVRNTFRFKLLLVTVLTMVAFLLLFFGGDSLIQMYLNESADAGDLQAALHYGRQYLQVMFLSLPAFMILQVYVSTMRECGETVVPMKAGVLAVFINLILNYILIYGKFGAPQLGIVGAAIGTVVARYVEMLIAVIWTHTHKEKYPYIQGVYRTLRVPLALVKNIVIKGTPLLINETLWASGMAILAQCYSLRGISVVAGLNIANTINNLFNVVFIALGSAVSIIIGQLLGAGRMEQAVDTDRKLIAFSVFSCVIVALVMLCIAPFFPQIYNTTAESKAIAEKFIIAQAIFMPQAAFMHAAYFTLRSGGKTIITFLFDSVFVCIISVPVAYVLSRFTTLNVIAIFVCVQIADWIKCIVGFILLKKGVWLQNIVQE